MKLPREQRPMGSGRIQEGSTVLKMIIRVASTTVAALALIAGTSAFSSVPVAHQVRAQHVTARHASPRVATHPMIPASLPAGRAAAAASAIGNIRLARSNNWAGYAVSRAGVKFRKISATFFVPILNCNVTNGSFFSSEWVGLDGFATKTVEQDGISADCNGGTPVVAAWYETFPHPEVQTSIRVRQGDSITASVTFNPSTNKYQMALRDNTNHRHFLVSQRCATSLCKRSSAEVISEAPFVNGSQSSMADYGAESFASISIASNRGRGGILSRHWTPTAIEQVGFSTGNTIAFPTALHGPAFDNYWLGPN
jgi:Peptidase A4 family